MLPTLFERWLACCIGVLLMKTFRKSVAVNADSSCYLGRFIFFSKQRFWLIAHHQPCFSENWCCCKNQPIEEKCWSKLHCKKAKSCSLQSFPFIAESLSANSPFQACKNMPPVDSGPPVIPREVHYRQLKPY